MAKTAKEKKALKAAEASKIQAEIAKKASLRVYITVGIIAAVISLVITFYSKWVPAVKCVVDKAVDIVSVEEAPYSE